MGIRHVSIRWSLLRNLLVLVALLAGAILTVMFAFGRRAVRTLSADLVERTADTTEVELNRFFEPVIHLLRISQAWAAQGVFVRLERQRTNDLFLPLLQELPHISSVNTGDARGNGFLLLRQPSGWLNREVRCEAWDCRAHLTTLAPDGEKIEDHWEELGYDPRERP
ncbi:MAG: hypothetical protein ACYTG6_03835, partial [Planctomycetota bacterium]